MRMSKMLFSTQREVPSEAEAQSHVLLIKAGMIRRLASGVYALMPLGLRVYKKIENIIREEMDAADGQELIMSAMLPAEYYQESGRWDVFGSEMIKFKDRNGRDFCLGPTHEEIFAHVLRPELQSYKSMPKTVYQIQNKYRDERRPRFGMIRSREFVMKDAYSFDVDEAGLDASYNAMHDAYCKVFDRCGLDYVIVHADSGAMGGSGSQEFMVKSDIGDDTVASCSACGYAANSELAPCPKPKVDSADAQPLLKVHTPNVGTIDDLTEFFSCTPDKFAKTLIYLADGEVVAVMVRGDRDLNETKLQNYLGCANLELASAMDVKDATNSEVGFAGPIGIKASKLIVDHEVMSMSNFIVGANETDYHYSGVNYGRDFKSDEVADIRLIEVGDPCPQCGGELELVTAIEVGHIFKLGTKYSEAMGCTFLDANAKEKPCIMGSYGIGLNRTMQAIIEHSCDEDGIIWPDSVAPYNAIVVPVSSKNEEQMELADQIYNKLVAAGIETLIDDRNERPGVKFKDADLIGIPHRITVGRRASEGVVEYKPRDTGENTDLTADDAIAKVIATVLR
ncbi:MAG: proline--tRNA ligase [Clostridia bacterium]|jgi:prolyl-tRNA synthetase|nr:proline--tRNA ligase [Clostridia bacterium]